MRTTSAAQRMVAHHPQGPAPKAPTSSPAPPPQAAAQWPCAQASSSSILPATGLPLQPRDSFQTRPAAPRPRQMAAPGSAAPAAPAPAKTKGQEEECPWCAYMKKGPCREVFVAWQSCVDSVMDQEEGRKLAVDKCTAVTKPLFDCMASNPGYYGPQLDEVEGPPSSRSSSSGSNGNSDSKAQQASTTAAASGQQTAASEQQAAASAAVAGSTGIASLAPAG